MTGLVVAGMHRSGTSLTARLFASGGWHPGESTLANDSEWYVEDASFVALHQNWLEAYVPVGDGHRDWGVSDGGQLDLDGLPSPVRAGLVEDARAFVDRRDQQRDRWIAKDPRAALFLPVWGEIESLRFVLVYRNPWDVADSAVRIGSDVFCRQPRLALRAWLDHNRRLAAFAAENRERCVVVASEAITNDPRGVWAFLRDRVDIDGDLPGDLVDPDRFVRRGDDSPIASLYRDVHPEHCEVLAELDRLADIPRSRSARGCTSGVTGMTTGSAQCASDRSLPGGTLPAGEGVQVIIPCRDDGDFLLEAIASVDDCARRARVSAGRDRVELTIVDDGSTDAESRRIIDVLRASGRHVITTPPTGLSNARNEALMASATCAVIPLDADNRLRCSLVGALEIVESDQAEIVHGPWQRFGVDRRRVDPPEMTRDALVPWNRIDACALISRAWLERSGGWDSGLPFWEDWDLWLVAVESGARTRRLDTITFDYLVRPVSLGSRPGRDPDSCDRTLRYVITKHREMFRLTPRRFVSMVWRHVRSSRSTEAPISTWALIRSLWSVGRLS